MHQYLRSIGFSKWTREKDIDKLLKSFEKHGMSTARRYIDGSEQMWLEIRMPVSERLGLCITGYIGARGSFHRVAYYPYLWSDDVTSTVKPGVFRRVDGRLFNAIIDDNRVGMTLIYQLDNPFDYLHKYGEDNSVSGRAASKLSGFCTKGFVLLPTVKADDPRVRKPVNGAPAMDDKQANGGPGMDDKPVNGGLGMDDKRINGGPGMDNMQANDRPGVWDKLDKPDQEADSDSNIAAFRNALNELLNSGKPENQDQAPSDPNNGDQEARMSLLEAARNGQTEAIEQLAMEEMHTIAMLSKRLQNEDIYSIVSTLFMPQGVECDIYLVIGDIMKIDKVRNESTREEIYDLTLNVNDMIIHVAINAADLEGEPTVGRRFKGRIWLQGRIEF